MSPETAALASPLCPTRRPPARDQPRRAQPDRHARLRELPTSAGFDDVRTYAQSGNVAPSSDAAPEHVARECEMQIATHLGLDIEVVTRTRDELAAVVRHNPLGDGDHDPKRYQVSFLRRRDRRRDRRQAGGGGRRTGAVRSQRSGALRLASGGGRAIAALDVARWE